MLSRSQLNVFGNIGGLAGASATIQVDFRTADGRPLPYATVKGKGPEPEKHPLFTNHDTVIGDVSRPSLRGVLSAQDAMDRQHGSCHIDCF